MRQLSVKESQDISLEILKVIADICDKNSLRYSLIYGTLLGAIRHNGFIPWDDDVDIMMPRPDYEKLLKYFKVHISDYDHLRVFNREECKEYPYILTRVSDDRYFIDMQNEKPYGMGVFVDIYPYDGLGNEKNSAIKLALKGDHLSSMVYQSTRDHFALETTTSLFRKLIKFPVYLVAKLIGKDFFQDRLEKLAGIIKYDESIFVGPLVWLKGGEEDVFPKEWFDELIDHSYGKYSFKIPAQYDLVLKHIYGDYMKLPPKEDQVGHHFYKVYEK